MKAWTLTETERKHRLQWAHEVPGNSPPPLPPTPLPHHHRNQETHTLQVIFISYGSAFGWCLPSSGELLLTLGRSAT